MNCPECGFRNCGRNGIGGAHAYWCEHGKAPDEESKREVRETIVDLNCGNGQLVQVSALTGKKDALTRALLGSDIDPCRSAEGDRVQEITGKAVHTPFNVFLGAGNRIVTALSSFESKSSKTNKAEADRMFKLSGKSPMELVLQRAERDDLLHVMDNSSWKIAPELRAAVVEAMRQYHASRAPLYPLPEIQRLGYLDEQDAIECKRDLSIMRNVVALKIDSEHFEHTIQNGDETETFDDIKDAKKRLKELNDKLPVSGMQLVYHAGRKYPIRTQTVQVQRSTFKHNNFNGDLEELEFTGQELAIFIGNKVRDPDLKNDDDFEEFCFMDEKLRDGKTKISEARQQKVSRRAQRWQKDPAAIPIDFSLQQLVEYFIIPDVPDVATNSPEIYRDNLQKLDHIEQLCNAGNDEKTTQVQAIPEAGLRACRDARRIDPSA